MRVLSGWISSYVGATLSTLSTPHRRRRSASRRGSLRILVPGAILRDCGLIRVKSKVENGNRH